MSKSLVTLSREVSEIENALVESGGEITPEIESMLSVREIQLPEKVDRYSFVMHRLEAAQSFYKERANAYQAAAKSIEQARENLKTQLKKAMHELQVTELEGHEVRYKLSASKPKVVILDQDLIPSEYKREVVTVKVDSDRLAEDLKIGDVPGAKLERVFSLRESINKGE